jgi:hypothetical protein
MAYIGNVPAEKYSALTQQTFSSPTGTSFTLSTAVTNSRDIALFIDNVRQDPTSYTAVGTALTTSTIASPSTMYCLFIGKTVETISPPAGSVDSSHLVTGSVDDGHITGVATTKLTGTVTDAQIAAMASSKLTGTIADARFPATLPAISGANLTNLPTTDLTSLQTNLATNFFLDAVNHARGVQNLSDGFVDQFEDQLGVDDANSTNETYDATNDLYAGSQDEEEYTGLTAGMLSGSGLQSFVAAQLVDDTLTGSGFYTDSGGAGTTFNIDLGSSNARALIGWEYYVAGTVYATWNIQYSDNNSSWTTVYTGMDMSGVSAGAGLKVTWSGAGAHRYWRSYKTNAAQGGSWHTEVRVYELGTSNNMTLVSESVTALAAPATAHVTLFKEDVDALTLNTDLLAWASRSKQTITSDFATDNKLDATSHGLSNNDRVMAVSLGVPIPMVSFDGTNDCLKITDAVLGQSDGTNYILAAWISHKADGVHSSMFATVDGGSRFFVQRLSANTIFVEPRQDNGSSIGGITTTATRTISDGAYHLMIVFNMSNSTAADRIKIYFNGVRQAVSTSTAMQHDNIDFTNTGFAIGANYNATTGSQKTTFEIGQIYLAEEYLDMDNATNLAKIYPAKDLGANASSVTGTTPLIYLNNATATFQNNLGSGGNFTEVGALTDGTNLEATANLPTGLSIETVYHVVNKTTNDFEVSLTSGGSAVALTSNGSGTHSVRAVTAATLVAESTIAPYDIAYASVDVSGQPSDTDMTLFVQSKNNKDFKLHGQSLQWS